MRPFDSREMPVFCIVVDAAAAAVEVVAVLTAASAAVAAMAIGADMLANLRNCL